VTGTRPAHEIWSDACRAAQLLAVDPAGLGGVALRSPAGEARAAWLAMARRFGAGANGTGFAAVVQIPADISAPQLLGGLDLEQTLALGRPAAQQGALARAHDGLLIIAMAERMGAASAGPVAAAMDQREVVTERDGFSIRRPARFGVVALDEGIAADERPPAALLERLAIHLDLSDVTHRDMDEQAQGDIAAARSRLDDVIIPDSVIESLCAAASVLGVTSGRTPTLALRLARAAAALAGRCIIAEEDVVLAARLVLGPRALQLPAVDEQTEDAPPPPTDDQPDETPPDVQAADSEVKKLDDTVLEAATAAIPPGLLQLLQENALRGARGPDSGKSGDSQQKGLRGRPIGSRRGELRSKARLDLLDTLRTAAPWQNLRRSSARSDTIQIRREDIRLKRFKDRQASTTIFVVDASGSTAMDRLGEAKGAIEMLLADCYVRRDEVALIAFRGAGADLLLPATRSLARAKRSLAALPGGGGTPLASGLVAAEKLADDVRRKGRTPTLVIITDGRANVARDGMGGRERAQAEAEQAAIVIRGQKFKAIVVDNSPRPEPKARGIAQSMGAIYLPLPLVNAAILSDAVRQHTAQRQPGGRA
jgi:magnesium chelatase subunit D